MEPRSDTRLDLKRGRKKIRDGKAFGQEGGLFLGSTTCIAFPIYNKELLTAKSEGGGGYTGIKK